MVDLILCSQKLHNPIPSFLVPDNLTFNKRMVPVGSVKNVIRAAHSQFIQMGFPSNSKSQRNRQSTMSSSRTHTVHVRFHPEVKNFISTQMPTSAAVAVKNSWGSFDKQISGAAPPLAHWECESFQPDRLCLC